MRAFSKGNVLKIKAISGLHVVILAWDFVKKLKVGEAGLPKELKSLLGFSIERDELDEQGQVVERYVLRGIKRFRGKDDGVAPGTPLPLDEHPIQSFLWADYTTKPDKRYRYRVTPMRGKPKFLVPATEAAVEIEIGTEGEIDPRGPGDGSPRHDVYANRGVIGSQAYARRFQNEEPDPDAPDSAPMKWLSRGLYEALLRFIGRANSERHALRAAFYEFHYPGVGRAFRRALDDGADVKIVYDAESSYRAVNEESLRRSRLFQDDIRIPRTVTEGIRHNKFIVLLEEGEPVAVWTGSTNISASGIFGQSNIGHVVWDKEVAQKYVKYWGRLAENLTPTKLREPNNEATPTPEGAPPARSVTPLFSPRDSKTSFETLQWYAARMREAERMVCLTVAFNLDQVFQEVISEENDVLRYIVKDDDLKAGETIGVDRDVLFAGGGRFDQGALPSFLEERDNPLSTNDYIHTKFLLVDPLSADPLVVSGSANFSRPSQQKNDENMLVIRGNTRVADIYLGEFMRIFDHHYARYIAKKLAKTGAHDPSAGGLKATAEEWVRPHFDSRSYKSKRRRYFIERP